ncbi:MAG: GNAT family N-acetyltransferase [Clostridia bacterium]|nr:GNAT family N-acetyltransferase [Clostridia bacterium]
MIKIFDKNWAIEYLKEKDYISNLNIIGAIQNISVEQFESSEAILEIFVDDVNQPKGIIVKEHEYWHYIYAEHDDFIAYAKKAYFDQLPSYGIDACDEKAYEILKKDRVLEWEERCILLYVDPKTFKPIEKKSDIRRGTVKDKEMVNDFYTFKDDSSLYFIEESLKNRPSSFYYDQDEPVAWVLMHRDDSIGIMYTKEQYRHRGIAYELTMDLLDQVMKVNKVPFIHIGLHNHPSFKLAEKCGFQKYKPVYWFGIHNEKKF